MSAETVDWTVTPLGTRFTGRSLALSRARVLAFSAGPLDEPDWPQRNLHTDRDKAREAGLSDIIASGTQSEGLLLGLLIELFDAHWYRGGELDVRFAKPVHVGDVVTPALVLQERTMEDGRMRLTLACTCETHPGHVVIEGTAMVTLATGTPAG